MVLLLHPNDPQQCAYTDAPVASWLQTCDVGRRIHDLPFQNTSGSCLGGEGTSPCYWCCETLFSSPLWRKIISKASREHTWIGAVNGRHAAPHSLWWSPAGGHEAGNCFCREERRLSQPLWASSPGVGALRARGVRERLDSNQLKL